MHLFMATDQGVVYLKSRNEEWELMNRSLTDHKVTAIAASEMNIIAGTTQGIHRSKDMGASWELASEGLNHHHTRWLAAHPDGSGLFLAGFEPAALYSSADSASSWRERPEVGNLRDRFRWMLPYSPEAGCVRGFHLQGNRAYAAVEVGGLLISDDRGETWSLVQASDGIPTFGPPQPGAIHPDVHSVVGHPSSVDLIFAPTGGGYYQSNDGGVSFARRYPACYCRAVWVDAKDPDHLVLGPADSVDRNGRIEESFDGGESWRRIDEGTGAPFSRTMVERFFPLGDQLLALLSDGNTLTAKINIWDWQPFQPRIEDVRAAAVIN